MKQKTKRVLAAQSKAKPIYRTVITIFPEVPTVPSYSLEMSSDGNKWTPQLFTTDPVFYDNLTKSANYKITDVVTNQELPL